MFLFKTLLCILLPSAREIAKLVSFVVIGARGLNMLGTSGPPCRCSKNSRDDGQCIKESQQDNMLVV